MGDNRRGRGGLIAAIVILVIINIACIGGGIVFLNKFSNIVNNENPIYIVVTGTPGAAPEATNTPADNQENTVTPQPTATVHRDPVAAKHVENLKNEIASAKLPEGVTAVVSVLDGSEYLKLTMGEYSFYYRNDYVKYGDDPYGKVIIEKGSLKKEYAWDYSLDAENIGNLAPVIFNWRENTTEQMAFAFKKMGDNEDECTGMHFVTCPDLIEYTTLSPEMGFENSVSIGGFVETDTETLICVVNDSRKYYFSAGKKLSDAEKANISLSAVNDVRYVILNERVFVYSKVELTGIGWIGEFSSRVTYSTFDVFGNHSNVLYCYAEQMIMNEDQILVMTPLKNYEDTKKTSVKLTGDDGEKMILFAKEGMQSSWQDTSLYEKDEKGYMHYNDDSVYTCWGVDVSRYNTVKDWKKVKAAGFSFALIRMGYRGYGGGSLQVDSKFVEHIEGALEAGLDVGVYYFTQAITVEEAVAEAQAVCNAIKKYKVKYPVIIDTEYYSDVEARANELPVQLRTDILKAFCEEVKRQGYTPMIYAGTNWSLINFDRSQLDEYDFWYAFYGLNMDYPYHYEIYQYASDGSVPGIDGKTDVNICFKKYK